MERSLLPLMSIIGVFFVLWLSFFSLPYTSDTSPVLHNGKKWRIAYYEGGPFLDYNKVFYETIQSLIKFGWIEETSLPHPIDDDSRILWYWITEHLKSNYLEFPKDALYSSNWDDKSRKETVMTLFNRITKKKDIDLLIVAGTQGGQDFVINHPLPIPTFVMTTSNAVAARNHQGCKRPS